MPENFIALELRAKSSSPQKATADPSTARLRRFAQDDSVKSKATARPNQQQDQTERQNQNRRQDQSNGKTELNGKTKATAKPEATQRESPGRAEGAQS
jgi:hypothetical protein